LILDTCFLIDVERKKSNSLAFLEENANEPLCIAAITVGELALGFERSDQPRLMTQLRHFQILDVTPEVAFSYSSAYRRLHQAGRMIGTNDLWIAAVGLANHLPVVTRNVEEFTRVPGLKVIGY